MKEILEKTFKNAKIDIKNENLIKFLDFFQLLNEENKKTNLTRIVDEEDVAKKHFLDSIMSAEFINKNAKIIDIGAGAGFPSIPLKILRDDLDMVMVDSVNKKVDFLNQTVEALKLSRCRAIHARCEELAFNNEYREGFDVCVARAVAGLNILCEYCLPFVKVGGLFIAYKGSNWMEEVEVAKRAIDVLGAKLEKVFEYVIDDDRKNVLIIFKKIGRTPNKYPRAQNKPRKEPIV